MHPIPTAAHTHASHPILLETAKRNIVRHPGRHSHQPNPPSQSPHHKSPCHAVRSDTKHLYHSVIYPVLRPRHSCRQITPHAYSIVSTLRSVCKTASGPAANQLPTSSLRPSLTMQCYPIEGVRVHGEWIMRNMQVTVLYTRAAKGSARRDKSRCGGWVGVKQGRGMQWNGINRRGGPCRDVATQSHCGYKGYSPSSVV